MSDDPRERHQRLVTGGARIAFATSALAAVGFAVAYVLDWGTQAFGAFLAVAFGGLACGLSLWGRGLMPAGGYVEDRPPLGDPRERELLAETVAEPPAGRRGLLGLAGLAVAAIGAALLFPLRSLYPQGGPDPATALSHTPWRSGVRLMTRDGRPVRLAEVSPDTILIVVPEGHPDEGDAPAFVVRLDPGRFRRPPPAGHVGGVVAYSLLCTHAGCPVSLYEQTSGRMMCPCHQSVFDLQDAAEPVSGPAARPLPGLPITADPDGFLRATGGLTGPPGAGFWSRP
ncbi:QcrA and Rieske domain-containing protein [Phytohabitans kaempferiae]|uniref:Cytochrome bc1 complex Rieske iron-sulfur subunit n=1 Tax=Phytohabitans kaempferiae TaxID=1620943 RepID=A0ABV6MB71_9ACTN